MKCRIEEPTRRRDGTWSMTITSRADLGEIYDELHEFDLDCELKKHRNKRSLDANAYCWVLIDKLALKLGISKVDVYRTAIHEIGGVSDIYCMKDAAVDKFCESWKRNGIGWMTETVKSKIAGCTNVIVYYGSSTYDTAQMSRLIDIIVQDCREQGIETMTPAELQAIKDRWGE